MLFCTREHVTDLLLADYVAACEDQNPGLVDRTIAAVSGEIATVLSYRYPQPWPLVPDLIRYIASVISAYRTVEAVTSLVSSEAIDDNEWIPEAMEILHGDAEGHPGRQAETPAR